MIRREESNTRQTRRVGIAVAILLIVMMSFAPEATPAAVTDSIRFFILDGFLNQPESPDTGSGIDDPFAAAARALANFYSIPASPADKFAWLVDPLRVPNPFESPANRSADLFARAMSRLAQTGISSTISYPADFAEAEESAAQAIVAGHPVLALHPRPILLFGYDYREPDPFWYILRFSPTGASEITTRSQWRADWWLWEADPASVTLIEIAGRDTTTLTTPAPEDVLEKVLAAAKTDTALGVTSYIRPILQLQDTLAKALTPPAMLNASNDPRDPLYLLQVSAQRAQFQDYLKSLLPLARDSTVAQSLRLSIYSAGKAAEAYAFAARELYGDSASVGAADSATIAESIAARWVEHRLGAAKGLAEAVGWERQMLTAIKDLTAMKKPFRQ